jgi:hypothetical protein
MLMHCYAVYHSDYRHSAVSQCYANSTKRLKAEYGSDECHSAKCCSAECGGTTGRNTLSVINS